MVTRGDVGWAPDPFTTDSGNPRAWLVLADESLPYPDQESMAVAFTTQSHHPGSFAVPDEVWTSGNPGTQSFVLPWTVATLTNELHVVGVQGTVSGEFTNRVVIATVSFLEGEAPES